MSSVIALKEDCPPVPKAPDKISLVEELRTLATELRVESLLTGLNATLDESRTDGANRFLLLLDPGEMKISVRGFQRQDSARVAESNLTIEKNIRADQQFVVVSVKSVDELKAAFPNYFLDTKTFVAALKEAIS